MTRNSYTMLQLTKNAIFVALPLFLASCFPAVNAPELSEIPRTERTYDASALQETSQQTQQDIDQLQKQKEALLSEE